MTAPVAGPELLGRAYSLVTAAVEDLAPPELLLGTRCRGWTVQDLVFHQLLDAQRALVAFATPSGQEPDVDAVTYWAPFRPGSAGSGEGGGPGGDDWAGAHARFVRVASSAYVDPRTLVSHWRTTCEATVRAAAAADPGGRVSTQGHVLDVPDFVSTLVVEATVHHLDLVVELPPGAPGTAPDPEGLALTRAVLEGIHGEPLPATWDDTAAVLKGTGRLELSADDRQQLGASADRLPLLG
ncbi:maleylpyruvate isomerase N-terminal domain-containing protein [Nocardioides sp. MAHUQ-72]|uniref:maleylpyruvate isomerase N-terminal domain-containing protein n=1 Tax=unclassified Nocardioides TaxID=2615069 RepID=UPI003614AF1D